MPLSKKRQAEYMREYRKRNRYNVIPTTPVIPNVLPAQVGTDRLARARKALADAENHIKLGYNVIPSESPPLYNPAIHKPGDTVRMVRYGKEVIVRIPLLDGDGHPIPWDD